MQWDKGCENKWLHYVQCSVNILEANVITKLKVNNYRWAPVSLLIYWVINSLYLCFFPEKCNWAQCRYPDLCAGSPGFDQRGHSDSQRASGDNGRSFTHLQEKITGWTNRVISDFFALFTSCDVMVFLITRNVCLEFNIWFLPFSSLWGK